MAEAIKPEVLGQTDGLKPVEGSQPVDVSESPLGIKALVDEVRGQRAKPEQTPQPQVAPKPLGMFASMWEMIHSTAALEEAGAHLTQGQ